MRTLSKKVQFAMLGEDTRGIILPSLISWRITIQPCMSNILEDNRVIILFPKDNFGKYPEPNNVSWWQMYNMPCISGNDNAVEGHANDAGPW